MQKAIVKHNPLSPSFKTVTWEYGQTLDDVYQKVLSDANIKRNRDFDEFFVILVNGHEIKREYWATTRAKPNTTIAIAVTLKSGDTGRILGAVALVATLFAITTLGPAGAFGSKATLTTFQLGAVKAFLATTAVVAYVGLTAPNSFSSSPIKRLNRDDSQTFLITNQSNSVKKLQPVPRVYGRHRVFPNVAANPYVLIEADPITGELVQYFYAIYDFGYGPNIVREIKIGDTLIEEYAQVDYQLVDLNKPAVSEGVWDDETNNEFTFYKQDIEQTAVSVGLNSDIDDPGATTEQYQAVRNAPENTQNVSSEVNVNVVFPSGLTSFGANGNQARVVVDVKLEFAEVGTEDWREFDDTDYVDDFVELQPGFNTTFNQDQVPDGAKLFIPSNVDPKTEMVPLSTLTTWNGNSYRPPDTFLYPEGYTYPHRSYYTNTLTTFGISSAQNNVIPLTTELSVGDYIYLYGNLLGEVLSVSPRGAGGFNHTISTPTPTRTATLGYYVDRVGGTFAKEPDDTYVEFFGHSEEGSANSVVTSKASQSGVNRFIGNSQRAVYGGFRFRPKTTNSIKIRMTRIATALGEGFRVFDDMTWSDITVRFDREPIRTPLRHTFLELRIKATDQLNGAIDNLSGVCTSVLDVYNGTSWEKQATRNPAWIYVNLLTGQINKRAIDLSRIDTTSVKEWADFCDEVPTTPPNVDTYQNPRFQANYILDYETTLANASEELCSASQASPTIIDGKYGVAIDKAKTTPVQIFTPRNSSGFSSTRQYFDPPDALKIRYIDEESNWEQLERVVYNDGFDENTAIEFEEIDSFAITNQEQAYRYGRYLQAQSKLRQEVIELTVDFEHLVCTRGDYVIITQDAMRAGGTPARVKEITGTTVTIDTSFATEPATSYGYTFRSVTGSISTSTMTITTPTTATLDGDLPQVGDLIVWGEISQITYDCIVREINPNPDLTARLILVEKNDAIFDAESSVNIPDYDPQLSATQDVNTTPPAEVGSLAVDTNSFDCDGSQYVYFVDLSWTAPTNVVFENFEIYVDNGTGFNLDGFTQQTTYRHIVDQNFLGSNHSFKVLAVSATGSKLTLGEVSAVSATPVTKTTPPSDVDGLFINITNETLSLDWDPIEDCDVSFYSIRYSPDSAATWEQSIELLRTDANTSLASVMARTGAYFVKAIDFNGNESDNAASAITSIPNLFNLNVVEETNDFPTFPGSLERVQAVGSELRLSEVVIGSTFESDGFYYYENFLDLGDVYTVRLQSLIEAEGYTYGDIMSNWVTLDSVPFLSNTAVAQWNVETYYRARNSAFAMSNWATLDVIDPISEGELDEWTSWRKFTIGDFTGRIFQFRLRLVSNQADVSPRVFDAKIKSDMPDRIYSDDNITSSVSGTTVTYSPAFYGPGTTPAIQITQDNASTGDYYTISNKTLESFDITFYDNTNTAVSRQFDVLVKGYGYKFTTTI